MTKRDEVRDHERVGHHRTGGDRLLPQLVEPAAVEQAVGLVRHACAGEETDQQGADHAADQVHADHVERVVVAEPGLEPDRKRADRAGDQADEDRTDRGDRAAGRGDGDQARPPRPTPRRHR